MAASSSDLLYVRELIKREAAIVLGENKNYLIEARLSPVARAAGLEDISAVVDQLRRGSPELRTKVVEALTTNETSFFRDVHPFGGLADAVLPALARSRAATHRLRVWSAAASTGQEAYSIAMVMREQIPDMARWDAKIWGTDITETVLEKARSAGYTQLEVNRGLPANMLSRHFDRDGLAWRVKPELRAMVDFAQLNLIAPWPTLDRFDVVFLRNVLIYFDVPTRRTLLDRIKRVLAPDGYLFLGSAETLSNVHDGYVTEREGRAIWYRPR